MNGLILTNLLKINDIEDCTYLKNTWDVTENFGTTIFRNYSWLLLLRFLLAMAYVRKRNPGYDYSG